MHFCEACVYILARVRKRLSFAPNVTQTQPQHLIILKSVFCESEFWEYFNFHAVVYEK